MAAEDFLPKPAPSYEARNWPMQDTLEHRQRFAAKVAEQVEQLRAAGCTVEAGIAPDERVITIPPGADVDKIIGELAARGL